MAEKKIGKQTVTFDTCPYIIGSAAVVGKKRVKDLCAIHLI